jgi:hypothetical protein
MFLLLAQIKKIFVSGIRWQFANVDIGSVDSFVAVRAGSRTNGLGTFRDGHGCCSTWHIVHLLQKNNKKGFNESIKTLPVLRSSRSSAFFYQPLAPTSMTSTNRNDNYEKLKSNKLNSIQDANCFYFRSLSTRHVCKRIQTLKTLQS